MHVPKFNQSLTQHKRFAWIYIAPGSEISDCSNTNLFILDFSLEFCQNFCCFKCLYDLALRVEINTHFNPKQTGSDFRIILHNLCDSKKKVLLRCCTNSVVSLGSGFDTKLLICTVTGAVCAALLVPAQPHKPLRPHWPNLGFQHFHLEASLPLKGNPIARTYLIVPVIHQRQS